MLIFNMLKLLLQAIRSNSNVQSQLNRNKVACNVCAGLKINKIKSKRPVLNHCFGWLLSHLNTIHLIG